MSVPYALAIHEDFLKTCIGLLETAGLTAAGTAETSKLATQHGLIETAVGDRSPNYLLAAALTVTGDRDPEGVPVSPR
jgi:hypothetical protein